MVWKLYTPSFMEYTLSLGTSKSRRSSVTVPTTTAVLLSLPVLFIRRTLTLHVQNYSNHQQQWFKLCCKTEFKQELEKKPAGTEVITILHTSLATDRGGLLVLLINRRFRIILLNLALVLLARNLYNCNKCFVQYQ